MASPALAFMAIYGSAVLIGGEAVKFGAEVWAIAGVEIADLPWRALRRKI